VGRAVALAGQDLGDREVLRVVERELRAQQGFGAVPVALAVAQVAAHQAFAHDVLLDRRRAEAVALAGRERQARPGRTRAGIDGELARGELGVEVAVAEGRAQQLALQLLVCRVAQLHVRAQREFFQRSPDERLLAPRASHSDRLLDEHHRRTRIYLHDGVPATVALRHARRHVRLVVAVGPQCVARLGGGALHEPPDHLGVQLRRGPEPVQARQRAHVLEQRSFDAREIHGDARILVLVLPETWQGRKCRVGGGRHEERQAGGGEEESGHQKVRPGAGAGVSTPRRRAR
jgi:hypothetical protein